MNRETILALLDDLADRSSNYRSYLHMSAKEQSDTSEFEYVAEEFYDWIVYHFRPDFYSAIRPIDNQS